MEIKGLLKTSLVDYPGHITATVFTGGCNMRCPFCHNRDLVLNEQDDSVCLNDFFDFLKKRKHTLEAVCVTGGEPTLQHDLLDFLAQIKNLGLKVKLDTNGLMPFVLESALDENLIDYVAMDIKNSIIKYPMTSGITTLQVKEIMKSVDLLKHSSIDYEFRTTVVKEFHVLEDLLSIAKWIRGSKNYYLQQYKVSDTQLGSHNYTPYSNEELLHFQAILPIQVQIRGIL